MVYVFYGFKISNWKLTAFAKRNVHIDLFTLTKWLPKQITMAMTGRRKRREANFILDLFNNWQHGGELIINGTLKKFYTS